MKRLHSRCSRHIASLLDCTRWTRVADDCDDDAAAAGAVVVAFAIDVVAAVAVVAAAVAGGDGDATPCRTSRYCRSRRI